MNAANLCAMQLYTGVAATYHSGCVFLEPALGPGWGA